jgi:hypothetical protein
MIAYVLDWNSGFGSPANLFKNLSKLLISYIGIVEFSQRYAI